MYFSFSFHLSLFLSRLPQCFPIIFHFIASVSTPLPSSHHHSSLHLFVMSFSKPLRSSCHLSSFLSLPRPFWHIFLFQPTLFFIFLPHLFPFPFISYLLSFYQASSLFLSSLISDFFITLLPSCCHLSFYLYIALFLSYYHLSVLSFYHV